MTRCTACLLRPRDVFVCSQGECWSGPKAGETYNKAGRVNTCITRDYEKCDAFDSRQCVGEKESNFVYGVKVPGSLQYCTSIIKFKTTRYFQPDWVLKSHWVRSSTKIYGLV